MTVVFPDRDIVRSMLAVILIGVLIIASFWILKPFLPSLIWATMVVVTTWPVMLKIQRRLWGRRGLAVVLMTAAFFLLIIVPFTIAVLAIVENVDDIVVWTKNFAGFTMPPPPDWLEGLPLVGRRLAVAWQRIAAIQAEGLSERLSPYVGEIIRWFARQIGGGALFFVQLLLTIAITAILYSKGETTADRVRRFALRMAGQRGEEAAMLAAKAVRAVALGVIVTAVVQSFLAGVGLLIVGIPYPFVLTAIIFMLVVAQIGPAPVMAPAVIWLYWNGNPVWGTLMLVWTFLVGSLDNLLKPVLIKRSANLSLTIVFVGVIGGLMAFGAIGIFVGPAVLGVTDTLLSVWIDDQRVEVPEKISVRTDMPK